MNNRNFSKTADEAVAAMKAFSKLFTDLQALSTRWKGNDLVDTSTIRELNSVIEDNILKFNAELKRIDEKI